MPINQVQFIQYIFDVDGQRHLSLDYRVRTDFVPFTGVYIEFHKPFFEWEFQVETVKWTDYSDPNFIATLKEIKYDPSSVRADWMNINSFEQIYQFYKIHQQDIFSEENRSFKVSDYNFRGSSS
jgi:hypothetical protein